MRLSEVLEARPEVGEACLLVARGLRELPFSLRGHEPANERALRDVERLRERVAVVVRLERRPNMVKVERWASQCGFQCAEVALGGRDGRVRRSNSVRVGKVGGLKGDASRARDAQRAAPELLDVEEHEARVAPEVRAGLAGRETRRKFRELRRSVEDLREKKKT